MRENKQGELAILGDAMKGLGCVVGRGDRVRDGGGIGRVLESLETPDADVDISEEAAHKEEPSGEEETTANVHQGLEGFISLLEGEIKAFDVKVHPGHEAS